MARHKGKLICGLYRVELGNVNGVLSNLKAIVESDTASSQESLSDKASSSVARGRGHNASGPWCQSAGTYVKVKSNIRMPYIHRFMAVFGCKSGSFNIPFMYLASTST